MSKPLIKIHNTETDEIIEREMTDSEFVEYQKLIEINQIENERKQAEAEAKAAQKAALLERLALTEAEAKLLLS